MKQLEVVAWANVGEEEGEVYSVSMTRDTYHDAPLVLAAPHAEPLVRYCPGCGSVGQVESKYRDCCPDGNEARMIPQDLAEKCRDTFNMAVVSTIGDGGQAEPVLTIALAKLSRALGYTQGKSVVAFKDETVEAALVREATERLEKAPTTLAASQPAAPQEDGREEALRCAAWMEHIAAGGEVVEIDVLARMCAAELRRLHAIAASSFKPWFVLGYMSDEHIGQTAKSSPSTAERVRAILNADASARKGKKP